MDLIAQLRAAIGADAVRTGADIPARNRTDVAAAAVVEPVALLLPRRTEHVAAALALCHAAGQPVVPQGGMTGLVDASRPAPDEIAISLERMTGIEEVDPVGGTITALAGTPLERVQQAAAAAGMMLGIDLGARGSCSIGGNVATNAGGHAVLRYGMMRANVRGLEAVLADGRVVRSQSKLVKNNTGYDWTQLMIGSEGTLGIVSRVTMAMHPRPAAVSTALAMVPDTGTALAVLRDLSARLPSGLIAFEAMWKEFYAIATGRMGLRLPFPAGDGVCLLIEAPEAAADGSALLTALAAGMETGRIDDAVVAQSEADRRRFWSLRESVYDHGRILPRTVGFDISFALDRIANAVEELRRRVEREFPGASWVVFGHLADCNLHVNIMASPEGAETRKRAERLVYGLVGEMGGSVSAEHGIGRAKAPYLHLTRTAEELRLMADIKRALDPKGILSPGRVLPTLSQAED
jgi:FAD/FMN-containing dehydrogenase